MKVSDEVVEVAAKSAYAEDEKIPADVVESLWPNLENAPQKYRAIARAALEAALPLVLGEPVAWIYEERYGVNDDAWIERINRGPLPPWEHRKARPLYAPKEQQP